MRTKKICALMMTLCLLLCSCGGTAGVRGSEELALDIRTAYLGMAACTASMDVTADYGARVYDYSMDFSWEKEGETVLTVTAPENIAGVTARIAQNSATMEYDGVSLETGPLDTLGLSPVGAVPALLDAVCRGYMAEVTEETMDGADCLRILFRDPEATPGVGRELTAWFDTGTHAMVRGEIASDGASVIQCAFTSFTMS